MVENRRRKFSDEPNSVFILFVHLILAKFREQYANDVTKVKVDVFRWKLRPRFKLHAGLAMKKSTPIRNYSIVRLV